MKKTIKFFSMAALAVLGAMTVSCSSDNDFNEQAVNKKNLVTTTLTINLDEGATTRALDDTGTKLVKTFAVGDQIVVFYNESHLMTERAVSLPLTAGDIKYEGKSATFTITLDDPKGSTGFRAVYPANMATTTCNPMIAANVDENTIDYSKLNAQDGTLIGLASLDLAIGESFLKSDGTMPSSVALVNKLAITKIKIKVDASDITSTITQLKLSEGGNNYTVDCSGLAAIYMAMKPFSGSAQFDATDGTNNYTKTVATATTTAGHITPVTLTMAEPPKAAAKATAEDLGKVIGADGKIYADADAATAASTSAVAIITYVGSDNGEAAPYNHGLALALSDVNDGNGCIWGPYDYDAGHTKQGSSSFTSESGLQYNATHNSDTYPAFQAAIANNGTAAPTGCSAWFLASGYQWTKMITAAGGAGSLATLVGLQTFFYWSSSEMDYKDAWVFYYNDGIWDNIAKDNARLVRSCLAF